MQARYLPAVPVFLIRVQVCLPAWAELVLPSAARRAVGCVGGKNTQAEKLQTLAQGAGPFRCQTCAVRRPLVQRAYKRSVERRVRNAEVPGAKPGDSTNTVPSCGMGLLRVVISLAVKTTGRGGTGTFYNSFLCGLSSAAERRIANAEATGAAPVVRSISRRSPDRGEVQ